MSELIKVALARLRLIWRKILAIHLIYTGLGIIFFVPLLGVLGQLLLKFSGEPAVADMDLLFFALSPTGALAFGLFSAVTIVISAFELASFMAVGVADASGKPIDVFAALTFSVKRTKQIFFFAGRLVVKVLIVVAPFLLAAGAVAFFLLTDYDINYYLAVQPPEFWFAAIVIGIIVVVMASFLISRLISWSIALPLVLFAGIPPTQSFSASARLTQQSRGLILRTLIVWSVTTLLLGVVITICLQIVAAFLVPQFTNSVTLLAIVFGLLTTLWFVASVAATAMASGVLALLLAALATQLEPGFGAIHMHPGTQDKTTSERKTHRKFAIALIAAAGVATFTGIGLLDDIQIIDEAQIVAHRGASGAAPENTMAAIHRAIADVADWIEIDVQETADGEIVVIHDSDFMKLSGVNLRVWEATIAGTASDRPY